MEATTGYAEIIQRKLGLSEAPAIFCAVGAAVDFARRSRRAVGVVALGRPLVAVVGPADDARRLRAAGYEMLFVVCRTSTIAY